MNAFPLPIVSAAVAGLLSLPFSDAATGTLLFAAGFGAIIHADYVRRQERIRLPKQAVAKRTSRTRPPLCCEPNRLAA